MRNSVDGAPWRRALMVGIALMLAVAMVACGDEDADEPAAQETESTEDEGTEDEGTEEEGGGELTVVATEYQFDFPETLPAGPITITLQNEGEQQHHLIMAKLSEDAPPIEKLIKLRNADKFLEEDITGNKPPLAAPGETSNTSIETELTPGTYGYVCFVGDKKTKKPHALLGMHGTFTVE